MSDKRALVCAPHMPDFDRQSGSKRLFDFIEFLRDDAWSVTFLAENAVGQESYVDALQQRGVIVRTQANADVESLIKSGHFDLALLSFWYVAEWLLPIIRRLSPRTRILVDSIDLHFVRDARRSRLPGRADGYHHLPDFEDTSESSREIRIYAESDGVLTVSQREADILTGLLREPDKVSVVPDGENLERSILPFARRQGILFIGNFLHPPNVDAIDYFCEEIMPRLDLSLLAEHPLSIVGNQLDDRLIQRLANLFHIRFVGWVPSVLPYLQHARISVVPLLYGAGTKRKLIQALMVGTPTVSTSIGIEGLDLANGEHVLVADDPTAFADSVARLLIDEQLWNRLVIQGRERIVASHTRDQMRSHFLKAIDSALSKVTLPMWRSPGEYERSKKLQSLHSLGIQSYEFVEAILPADATFIVAGIGNRQPFRRGQQWRLQQLLQNVQAYYPVNSREAIDHLEPSMARGGVYVLFPPAAFWWLRHFPELRQYLEVRYDRILDDKRGIIYGPRPIGQSLVEEVRMAVPAKLIFERLHPPLPRASDTNARPRFTVPETVEDIRASVPIKSLIERLRPLLPSASVTSAGQAKAKVLVVGVYLADKPNNAEAIVSLFAESAQYEVTQCWAALGRGPCSGRLRDATKIEVDEPTPKFVLINQILAQTNLDVYEYLLLCDDDIRLPDRFLDRFLSLQARLDLRLAQPARTSSSSIDHPIVQQQRGVVARETLFVESGPVVSAHRSIYDLLMPFDLTSPMGWGYDNIWSYRLSKAGLKMGIIDAFPVEHSMRGQAVHYSSEEAHRGRNKLLEAHPHRSLEDCFKVLSIITDQARPMNYSRVKNPRISVVIPTFNRASLLRTALDSLVRQNIPSDMYEVVVIDDGSQDATFELCMQFSAHTGLRYYRIEHSGKSAAKNLGIFLSSAPLLLFFDDDDIADRGLLAEHLDAHLAHPQESIAVLGHTAWTPGLRITPVMRYVTNVRGFLFSYGNLANGQMLDFTYYWASRSSCKRSFLANNRIFSPLFEPVEDIELGYRLAKLGLQVKYWRHAQQHMNRAITFEGFCQRCERQGRAYFHFARVHGEDPIVEYYCKVQGAEARWAAWERSLPSKVARVRELEFVLGAGNLDQNDSLLSELYSLYEWCFNAYKTKGIVESMQCSRIPRVPDSVRPR